MIHIHCIESECMYNTGLAQCANIRPQLVCLDVLEDTPEYHCDSYLTMDAMMEGTDW